jgi:hypothetical protein
LQSPLELCHLFHVIRPTEASFIVPRVVEVVLALAVLRFRPQAVERWVIVTGIITAGGILSTLLSDALSCETSSGVLP